jgi:hypothetical protein
VTVERRAVLVERASRDADVVGTRGRKEVIDDAGEEEHCQEVDR